MIKKSYTAPALEYAGDKRAVGPLIEVLKGKKWVYSISSALKKLTGQDFGQDYDKWKAWYEKTK